MKALSIISAATIAGVLGAASMASASTPSLIVPIDRTAGGLQGSTLVIATADVDAELQGIECEATALILNQESVHPGNDLLITSGGVTVEILDVEGASFSSNEFILPIVLGETVSVSVRFGPDQFFSGGFDVEFDCSANLPATSIAEPTTTVEAPATTVDSPTTTDDSPQPAPTDVTTTTTPVSVIPDGPTTVAPGPATTIPGSGTPDPDDVLPETGSNTTTVFYAFGFLAVGALAIAASRRRPSAS